MQKCPYSIFFLSVSESYKKVFTILVKWRNSLISVCSLVKCLIQAVRWHPTMSRVFLPADPQAGERESKHMAESGDQTHYSVWTGNAIFQKKWQTVHYLRSLLKTLAHEISCYWKTSKLNVNWLIYKKPQNKLINAKEGVTGVTKQYAEQHFNLFDKFYAKS